MTTQEATQPNPNLQEVTISQDSVVVKMNGIPEKTLSPTDFEKIEPRVTITQGDLCFYIAVNEEGVMERVISINPHDRKVIAAQVGNWVAQGFGVQRITSKELLKRMRIVASAQKEAPAAVASSANSAPTQNEDPAEPESVANTATGNT